MPKLIPLATGCNTFGVVVMYANWLDLRLLPVLGPEVW